jgi:NAD(P)-dependent dehydrogenase (short-subunit alcohol dehydrogenase family)
LVLFLLNLLHILSCIPVPFIPLHLLFLVPHVSFLFLKNKVVAEKLLENTALKRFVEKREVADVVLSIASSTGITGQAIMVDGGSLML